MQQSRAVRIMERRSSPSTRSTIRRRPPTSPLGRAIFSLAAAGAEVRRFPLPSFPLDARWTKLEVFPNDPPIVRMYDAEGNEIPNTEALQTGRVWQAEEVREGDRWRRYYGFVGRHALTRVAAEEIEFLTPWQKGWSLLSTDLDARIVVKEAATTGPVLVELAVAEPPRRRDDGSGRSRPRSRRRAHGPRRDRLPACSRVGQAPRTQPLR